MKISLSMDLGQLAEGMGTEATHEDARRLREVLVRSGFENLEDLPEGAWWRMVDEAFKDWRPTPTPETTMTPTHTPGPWTVDGNEIFGPPDEGNIDSGVVVARRVNPADAKLIAKAPEMHALLLVLHANAGESPEWIRARIEAVIGPAGA